LIQWLFLFVFLSFQKVAIQKITIADFLQLAQTSPVFDVRSPGEYDHAHLPGAYNLPLFTNEERAVVGTAYKQQGKQPAIKLGLDYFGVKMKAIVEAVEAVVSVYKQKDIHQRASVYPLGVGGGVLVHCWRGGMRSAGIAWLLDLYGFQVYTLAGGYKSYRKWVRDQFENTQPLTVLGGYTGSGKTIVLHQLQEAGLPVIDLEAMANHKGSAFGAMGQKAQPSQEMFENLLAEKLNELASHPPVPGQVQQGAFIEDESQRIGDLKIPDAFWKQMRSSNILFLDIPFEERLNYLTGEYGKVSKEKLVNAIIRIQKRLGGLEAKNAVNFLLEDNHKECFRILLKYYDKWYEKGLYNRESPVELINKISAGKVDAQENTGLLLNGSNREESITETE